MKMYNNFLFEAKSKPVKELVLNDKEKQFLELLISKGVIKPDVVQKIKDKIAYAKAASETPTSSATEQSQEIKKFSEVKNINQFAKSIEKQKEVGLDRTKINKILAALQQELKLSQISDILAEQKNKLAIIFEKEDKKQNKQKKRLSDEEKKFLQLLIDKGLIKHDHVQAIQNKYLNNQ